MAELVLAFVAIAAIGAFAIWREIDSHHRDTLCRSTLRAERCRVDDLISRLMARNYAEYVTYGREPVPAYPPLPPMSTDDTGLVTDFDDQDDDNEDARAERHAAWRAGRG